MVDGWLVGCLLLDHGRYVYVTINTIPFSGALLLLLLLPCSHLFRISHSADDDVPCVVSIVLLRSQITPPAFAAEQEMWCSLSLPLIAHLLLLILCCSSSSARAMVLTSSLTSSSTYQPTSKQPASHPTTRVVLRTQLLTLPLLSSWHWPNDWLSRRIITFRALGTCKSAVT